MEVSFPGEKASVDAGCWEEASRQTSASFTLFLSSESDSSVRVSRMINLSYFMFFNKSKYLERAWRYPSDSVAVGDIDLNSSSPE